MISNAGLTVFTEASAPLKVSIFFLVWAIAWLPIAIPLAIALKWRPPQPIGSAQKLPLLASLYLLAPAILWGAAWLEGVPFADYGLPWDLSIGLSVGGGLLLGVAGLALLFAIERGLGWLTWQRPLPSREASAGKASKPAVLEVLLPTLLLGLWVSLTEELIFRGFLINQLQQDYSAWMAAAIASLIFALLHLVWEGSENIPQLPGLWLMGMVLVLARWVDGGNLGLAWGLHAGWIWAIASLETMGAIAYTGKGAVWLTGGGGKPLAGAMGILFLLVTGAVLWGVTYFAQG
jgi:membrane protease YdiL (CAAX protease family)